MRPRSNLCCLGLHRVIRSVNRLVAGSVAVVHRFQKTERGWCELFVEMDTNIGTEHHFKFVAHSRPTIRNVLTVDARLQAAKVCLYGAGPGFGRADRS